MRIAVISDVHGNRFALEAVLEDVRASSPDAIANLGDQVLGLADPAGAYALQKSLNATAVRGNTEELYTADLDELEGARADVEQLRALLPGESVAHLRGLSTVATLAGGEVLLCHGTPQTPWLGLTQVREDGKFREATNEEMLERLDGARPRVVVAGHLHTEKLRGVAGITFVNSGPVSYQNDGDPAARWTLLERRGRAWSITFRRVEYDHEAAARWVETHFPEAHKDAPHLRLGRWPN